MTSKRWITLTCLAAERRLETQSTVLRTSHLSSKYDGYLKLLDKYVRHDAPTYVWPFIKWPEVMEASKTRPRNALTWQKTPWDRIHSDTASCGFSRASGSCLWGRKLVCRTCICAAGLRSCGWKDGVKRGHAITAGYDVDRDAQQQWRPWSKSEYTEHRHTYNRHIILTH